MTLSTKPIFIVGSPRSGTTLMRSILDAHPGIFCPCWETGLFVHMDAMMNGDLVKVMKHEMTNFPVSRPDLVAWVRRSALDLIGQFGAQSGKPRWAEKTPAHVHHMNFILEVFPDAQFVHMIRSGSDVVKSLQNMPWAPRQIRWSINTWVDSVQKGREVGARLPASQYTEVRYEKLIQEPHEILKGLCEFLGEPFAPQMLEFHNPEKNSWKTKMQPLQNKPVNDYQGLNFWHRLLFTWSAGGLMRELGYR
jgi:hypothetical protein